MDKTPDYIKMCEAAGEVQELWEPALGDYVFNPLPSGKTKEILIIARICPCGDFMSGVPTDHRDNSIINIDIDDFWLPTQSQLQAMVVDGRWDCDMWDDLFDKYYSWYQKAGIQNYTFEQNWLGYVMHTNHNKSWDGTNWEPITT